MKDHTRIISLQCPLCGKSGCFSDYDNMALEELPDDFEFTCYFCNNSFSKKRIIEANSELIQNSIKELATEVINDSLKTMKDSFRGIK